LMSTKSKIDCGHCAVGEAVCFGCHEGDDSPIAFACDDCCGHGSEDGWCYPLGELEDQINRYRDDFAMLYGLRNAWRDAAEALEKANTAGGQARNLLRDAYALEGKEDQ